MLEWLGQMHWGTVLQIVLIDVLLGWIGGGMLITDTALAGWLDTVRGPIRLIAEIAGALLVMGLGIWLGRRAATARTSM